MTRKDLPELRKQLAYYRKQTGFEANRIVLGPAVIKQFPGLLNSPGLTVTNTLFWDLPRKGLAAIASHDIFGGLQWG